MCVVLRHGTLLTGLSWVGRGECKMARVTKDVYVGIETLKRPDTSRASIFFLSSLGNFVKSIFSNFSCKDLAGSPEAVLHEARIWEIAHGKPLFLARKRLFEHLATLAISP